ncbi:MAG TPA: serine hydrolase domain-containing protein [Thermomicrobiales bacterium]|jgi:beta-lactamase class C
MAPAASWPAVQRAAEEIVASGQVPGVVAALARDDGAVAHIVVGTDGAGTPLAADTLSPVASLTKLATALAVLRLVDSGALDVADPLARHLPDAAAAREGVRVRHLFTHTAGLPFNHPEKLAPMTAALTWADIARATLRTAPTRPPGEVSEYSNVGYNLLGIIVERVTGQPFPEALDTLVLRPLAIEGYMGVAPPRVVAHIDGVPGPHGGTDLDPYNSPFGLALVRPNGGLVTTAVGGLALVRAFLGHPADFLRPATRAAATRDQTGGVAGIGAFPQPRAPHGLGPVLRYDGPPYHAVPPTAGPAAFGHGGSSGCRAWADPATGVAVAVVNFRFGGLLPWVQEAIAAFGEAVLADSRT